MKTFIKFLTCCMVGLVTTLNLHAQPSSIVKGTNFNLYSSNGKIEILRSPLGKYIYILEKKKLYIWSVEQNKEVWIHGNQLDGCYNDWKFEDNGNLNLYNNCLGIISWSSNTGGKDGKYLNMQDDGNLVMYNIDFKAVWATGTCGGIYNGCGSEGLR